MKLDVTTSNFAEIVLYLHQENWVLKMRNSTLVVASMLLLICYSSCKKDLERVPCNGTNPTWTSKIEEIVVTSCVSSSCHGTSAPGPDYTTYANLKSTLLNGQFESRVLEIRDMPNDGTTLPDSTLAALQCWAEDGFPEN
jgi:hypothetical protein